VTSDPVPAQTGGELKERLEVERRGEAFFVYRDSEGRQQVVEPGADSRRLAVGRAEAAEICLDFDEEVSRLHAELERIADDWILVDDGLSRNGSFVNGERIAGRRRLHNGDALRFGSTLVLFRSPVGAGEETAAAGDTPDASSVSPTQKRVLIALCRPFREGSEFATPATNKEISDEVFLSVDAVKAHLRALFEKFQVGELPQNQKRIRLAELAMRSGVISPRDLAE
jgi:pSer/pThr/pTyr-binding forkhead associated (FHA) protein